MSIKDEILKELKERIRERIKEVDVKNKQAEYIWLHTSQIENDRYELGVANSTQDELKFLSKFLEVLKSM